VHLSSVSEGVAYAKELFEAGHSNVVIEEKLDGEEFSLQSFCDGVHVVDIAVVQDHKRAYEGDVGLILGEWAHTLVKIIGSLSCLGGCARRARSTLRLRTPSTSKPA